MTPEDAAAALLEKAGLAGADPPIDVHHVAEEVEGLDVQEHADLTTVEGAPPMPAGVTLSGLLIPATRRLWVNAVEARRSGGRRRFTIAHELGHWCLHSTGAGAHTRFCRSDEVGVLTEAEAQAARQIEREANRFAAALLMPAELVRAEAPRHHLNVKVLADRFGVSVPAMQVRLESLRLLPDYMKR
jgi:hypothetical protein